MSRLDASVFQPEECQHTSCGACFLHVKPNCTRECGIIPAKRCLKKYYRCVQAFYSDEKRPKDLIIVRSENLCLTINIFNSLFFILFM